MNPVVVLYDGACPVCVREKRFLAGRDRAGRLRFVDIATPGFDPRPYGTTRAAMMSRLHALRSDGTLAVGVDAVRAAYAAVGLGWLLAPTSLRWVRPLADRAYAAFARHRYRISGLGGLGCSGRTCRAPD